MKELTAYLNNLVRLSKSLNLYNKDLEFPYEDMGNILGRYYEIGEKHIPES